MPAALPQLVAQLQQGLIACGYPPEERPFQAHITLLRKIRRPPEVEQLDSPLSWPVSEFVLVESRTLPQGAEYRILRQWPLL
jgi:2'-5' RNA ligase